MAVVRFKPSTLPYRLRDYTLIRPIGKGSQATVYLARREGDLGFRRDLAVKIVGTMEPGGGRELQAIANEARALAAIYHPNVVQVFDFRSDGRVFFLVMELVRGVNVRKILARMARRGGGIPVPEAIAIAKQVALGLGALHGLKDEDGSPAPLVHRDLKPENIIISGTGQTKLVDFGIIQWDGLQQAGVRSPGFTRGTPSYMSPEQVVGRRLTPRSDVFSFGSVLFEMVTGRLLFGRDEPRDVMQRIYRCRPDESPDLVNEVCPRLLPVLVRCLHREPRKRYGDPAQLAEDLELVRQSLDDHSDLPGLLARTGLAGDAWFQEVDAIPSRLVEPVLEVNVEVKRGRTPRKKAPPQPVKRAPWDPR